MTGMTKLLDQAIAAVRALPDRDQDMAAALMLAFASSRASCGQLSDAQVAEVERARREVREGKIATDAEMAELWQSFGLRT